MVKRAKHGYVPIDIRQGYSHTYWLEISCKKIEIIYEQWPKKKVMMKTLKTKSFSQY